MILAVVWVTYITTMLDVGKVHAYNARPAHQDFKAEECKTWSTPWAMRAANILSQWVLSDATMMIAHLLKCKRLQDSKNCFVRVWLRVGSMLMPLVLAAVGVWLTVTVAAYAPCWCIRGYAYGAMHTARKQRRKHLI